MTERRFQDHRRGKASLRAVAEWSQLGHGEVTTGGVLRVRMANNTYRSSRDSRGAR